MLMGFWESLFLVIVVMTAVTGLAKGGLRMITLVAAHLFPGALALSLSPYVAHAAQNHLSLGAYAPLAAFLLLYLLPMAVTTQFFRALYRRSRDGETVIGGVGRLLGLVAGLILGLFFCFLLTWILLLQPFVSRDAVFSAGGSLFHRVAQILNYFMRFYV